MRVADEAFKTWSRTPVEERVELVLETARIIRERKYQYIAWLCYEVGKTWVEADADVAEAIDLRSFTPVKSAAWSRRRHLLPCMASGISCVTFLWGWGLSFRPGISRLPSWPA